MGQLKLIYFEKALQEFFNYYIVKPLLGRPSVQLTPSIKRTPLLSGISHLFL